MFAIWSIAQQLKRCLSATFKHIMEKMVLRPVMMQSTEMFHVFSAIENISEELESWFLVLNWIMGITGSHWSMNLL